MTKQYEFAGLDVPAEAKLDLCQKGLWGLVARILRIVEEKYGQEGIQAIYNGIRDWDIHQNTVPGMLTAHGIKPEEASPIDLVLKVNNPMDSVSWTFCEKPQITEEPDENRIHYLITSCNVAETIRQQYPNTCRIIANASYEAQVKASNPNLKVIHDKFLCEGSDACDIYVEKTK